MTKQNNGYLWSYNRATDRDIYEAYKSPSRRKVNAFRHCKEIQYILNGYDGRITAASCHFFSYAFKYRMNGHEYLKYITYANEYDIPLDEVNR